MKTACCALWSRCRSLRALDAIALLHVHERTRVDAFVDADAALAEIALLEGLTVIDPETL